MPSSSSGPKMIGGSGKSSSLVCGDCLNVLRTLPDNSVDAVVTDPPYGLSFMGKKWDYDVPAVEVWAECLRVLKPGGHLLAFAGTRTQHRMAVRIEDAGFEIRDMIAWVYGSGFPKSLDVSKAIDKVRDWSKVEQLNTEIKRARDASGLSLKQIGEAMQAATDNQYGAWYHRGGHMFFETGRNLPSRPEWEHLRRVLPIAPEFQDAYDQAEREVIGTKSASRSDDGSWAANVNGGMFRPGERDYEITAPATEAARRWSGWGTALKPALEPITVARKPLVGTVAECVLAHGTGAINIDGCRVGSESTRRPINNIRVHGGADGAYVGQVGNRPCDGRMGGSEAGRWPANLIHDGSAEVLAGFPVTGPSKAAARGGSNPNPMDWGNSRADGDIVKGHNDTGGSAARFFYCAKASKRDRDEGLDERPDATRRMFASGGRTMKDGEWVETNSEPQARKNSHPTVKPTDLMRYLCRLITPPGGVVLDPFMGSGSTGKAAIFEGFRFIGIERDPEYLAIAEARIRLAEKNKSNIKQPELFNDL